MKEWSCSHIVCHIIPGEGAEPWMHESLLGGISKVWTSHMLNKKEKVIAQITEVLFQTSRLKKLDNYRRLALYSGGILKLSYEFFHCPLQFSCVELFQG